MDHAALGEEREWREEGRGGEFDTEVGLGALAVEDAVGFFGGKRPGGFVAAGGDDGAAEGKRGLRMSGGDRERGGGFWMVGGGLTYRKTGMNL